MSEPPAKPEAQSLYAGFPRRGLALAWDLPVIAAWALFAGIVGVALNILVGPQPRSPWALDLQAFLTLILPVVVTFAYLEGSGRQATFGKRRLRLIVTDACGRPPGSRRALIRSAVRFLPWQLGHTAVFHLAAGSTSIVFVGLSIGAQMLVVASVLVMAIDARHRALHDWVAGTRVMEGSSRARAGTG
jgi:uncharacterized RDD family membrane protein YckC